MKKLFLLDGHALLYRAHFAFIGRPLMNSKGWNVSAVQGFMRTLWDLIQKENPTHLAVVFDPPTDTFRHEKYEAYKANRDAQPEDIGFALPWVTKILQAMHIPVLSVDHYEADDVIGTLAKQAARSGYRVFMVTPDKDFGQLVDEKVLLYKPGRQGNDVEIWGPPEVCSRWGIQHVHQVVDMLGLMGDAVDNIPGVPGIGEKTAAKLLTAFQTIENLLENTDKLQGKQQETIRAHADKAILSKWLATIHTEVPVQFDERTFEIEPFDREALLTLFRELEFRTLSDAILQHPLGGGAAVPGQPQKPNPKSNSHGIQGSLFDEPASQPPIQRVDKHIHNTPHTYLVVQTPESLADLVAILQKSPYICFDTETTHLEATRASLVGMSFSVKPHEAWYVPVPSDNADAQRIVDLFKPIWEDPSIEKIGQNLKYDAIVLKNYGVNIYGPLFDTMLAHYLLEPSLRHNMNYMAETLLGYDTIKIESLIGKKSGTQGNMRDVPLDDIAPYAAEDADITIQLYHILNPKLKEGGDALVRLFRQVEAPLSLVLAEMEYQGVRIDPKFLRAYSDRLSVSIADYERIILEKAGFQFNIASPKQVGEVLFERMRLPYSGKKMKSGQYSTDEEILNSLAHEHSICADILQHRMLMKLRSTYVDALPALINPKTGRIHTSFNQALAATGRLSSQNPNLQNIPIRTPEGRKVREAFIPRDEHHVLLSADYSQVELRLIAEISKDKAMTEAFQQGLDIHQATASKVFGVPLDAVTPAQRRAAKTVNFSITYGAGAHNLANQLGIKRAEAKEIIDNYFVQYSGLKQYMDNTIAFARSNGYVETLLGRRRFLRDINSRNGMQRAMAERMAINTPIQGTAADMIKIAMVNLHEAMNKQGLKSRLILQVHDELLFDAHKTELSVLKPLVTTCMQGALKGLQVPIVVDIGTGQNWLEAH
jgi:DNA polymerase-1